jgi:oligoribonuclease (3'-5' exoribonuclease)
MTKLRPYLALDIETTGLDEEKSQILQIGWVIDDGISPLDQLKKGSVIVKNETITYGEDFALGMNGWIFQEISKKEPKYLVKYLEPALMDLFKAIQETGDLAYNFDIVQEVKKPSNKVQLAGKNVGNFDWPIIVNNYKRSGLIRHKPLAFEQVDHRFIDCGAIFFSDFGKNPGFAAINKLIGWKDINHDALDDAINVVVAIRYKAGINIQAGMEQND